MPPAAASSACGRSSDHAQARRGTHRQRGIGLRAPGRSGRRGLWRDEVCRPRAVGRAAPGEQKPAGEGRQPRTDTQRAVRRHRQSASQRGRARPAGSDVHSGRGDCRSDQRRHQPASERRRERADRSSDRAVETGERIMASGGRRRFDDTGSVSVTRANWCPAPRQSAPAAKSGQGRCGGWDANPRTTQN